VKGCFVVPGSFCSVRVIPVEDARKGVDLVFSLGEDVRLTRICDHYGILPEEVKTMIKLLTLRERDARVGFSMNYQDGRMAIGDEANR